MSVCAVVKMMMSINQEKSRFADFGFAVLSLLCNEDLERMPLLGPGLPASGFDVLKDFEDPAHSSAHGVVCHGRSIQKEVSKGEGIWSQVWRKPALSSQKSCSQ